MVAVADADARDALAAALVAERLAVDVVADVTALVDPADVVVNGVVGFAGLPVTMATLRGRQAAGSGQQGEPDRRRAGGAAVARRRPAPSSSRSTASTAPLHQCLRSSDDPDREVARLLLTASGGPFRGRTAAELADVTVDEALAHPTWSMGPKITIDSSTLMNKGLEVIEAHELFGTPYDRIDVVVHPQSVVHSMVEFTDGSTIAQLSMPDMRLPIGYALGYPQRIDVAVRADRLGDARPPRLRAPRPDDVPLPRPRLRSRDVPVARHRRGSAPPTRWRSTRSSPGDSLE